ncbi:MAG: type II toxin-antitoxin system VapC family toxin [Candidatus Thermoplasmatota archaeon]
MRCLDRSVLIDLTRDLPSAVQAVGEALAGGAVTTEVNAFELYSGAHERGRQVPRDLAAVERILRRVDVLPLNRRASIRGAEIASLLRSRGQDVGGLDVLIAAIAMSHGINTIVTEDADDFRRIPGLHVETYR